MGNFKKRTTSLLAVILLLLVALQSNNLQAQITTGSITASALDATKSVMPGVVLTLTHASTQTQRKTTTDANGAFQFNFLPLGEYSIQADIPGFETVLEKGIQVRVNETVRVDLTMNPSQTHQVVEVTESAPPLQTQSGEVSGVVEHKAIENLPLNGRSFVQLVALEPGGVSTTKLAGGGVSWSFPLQSPPWTGVLATAGGLVFASSNEGNFFALDDKTGKPLRDFQTGSAIRSNPISFLSNGKQQIAIAAGRALFVFSLN